MTYCSLSINQRSKHSAYFAKWNAIISLRSLRKIARHRRAALGESVLGCYGCSTIRTSSDLHAVTRFASSFTHAVFSECRNFSCSGMHVGRFAIFYLPDATRQHDDTTEQTIHARVKNRGRRSSSRLTSHPLRRTGFQHSASTDSRAIRTPTESTTESEGELGHGGVRYLRQDKLFPSLSFSLFFSLSLLLCSILVQSENTLRRYATCVYSRRRGRCSRSWAGTCPAREEGVSKSCLDLVCACGPLPSTWRLSPGRRRHADADPPAAGSPLECETERLSRHRASSA